MQTVYQQQATQEGGQLQSAYLPHQNQLVAYQVNPQLVVVEQPTATVAVPMPIVAPAVCQVQQPRKAHDFLAFSIALMICCGAHGNIFCVLLTLPALFFSIYV